MEELYSLFLKSSGICTDTRKIEKDCFFVALKGANFNGNTFAEEALKQGALCAIIDESNYIINEQTILVEDCLKLLQDLALYHRKQFSIPVIGITGSNGKTTSKELIAAVLSEQYNVHYTKGNLNNHIGVPLTLLELNNTHEIALIEMGANKFKDIAELCAIAEPSMGMITNIGKAHLEGFINFDGVLKTKKELYDSVSMASGKIIYNADDAILTNILPGNTQNTSYGQSNSLAYISGKLMEQTPFVQLQWTSEAYTSPTISTNLVGEYNFYNFLAAITFGRLFDVSPEKINHALSQYTPKNNRSQVNKTDKNTIIVDCYNANPTSMESAIRSFSMIEHDKKIAILGDMRELGHEEVAEHTKVLELLKTLKIEAILVGNVFSSLVEDEKTFASADLLKAALEIEPIENALILLKGSRGIQLEKLLDVL